jgi:hypothetical protein
MDARFAVEGTFQLESRRAFVVHGQIIEGVIQVGQHVRAPAGIEVPVSAIGFILLSATEGRENPALSFCYRSEDELTRWRALILNGEVLELEEPRSVSEVALHLTRHLGERPPRR